MPTTTKPTIDPAVESGAVAFAEGILPPDEARLEAARALEEAWGPFAETRDRIASANQRVDEIGEELRATRDPKEQEALLVERTALTGQLFYAGADIEAVAVPYAEALGRWATWAFTAAREEIRRLVSEQQPLVNKMSTIRRRLQPDRSQEAVGSQEAAKLEKEYAELAGRREELAEQQRQYEGAGSAASGTVSRFGDNGPEGRLFAERGKSEWLRMTRVHAGRSTVQRTGISDMLKPMATGS